MVTRRAEVIGAPIDVLDWNEAVARISELASQRSSACVCICNAHSLVTARNDAEFGRAVRSADLTTADGAPVAWMLRRLGYGRGERINGPDLMWRYCDHAARTGQSIFLYGATERTLELLRRTLSMSFPGLQVAGSYSPPFRELTDDEDADIVLRINDSGASVVWVGLGCPKQEKWMMAHRGRIMAVMVGVGAAFDYHAGTLKRAPLWMQRNGLEWFYRLVSEPRRLWRRYLVTNSLFLWYAARQLAGLR